MIRFHQTDFGNKPHRLWFSFQYRLIFFHKAKASRRTPVQKRYWFFSKQIYSAWRVASFWNFHNLNILPEIHAEVQFSFLVRSFDRESNRHKVLGCMDEYEVLSLGIGASFQQIVLIIQSIHFRQYFFQTFSQLGPFHADLKPSFLDIPLSSL